MRRIARIWRPPPGYVRPRHYAWAELLRHTFSTEILGCPDCGSRLRLLATITDRPARPVLRSPAEGGGFRRAGRGSVPACRIPGPFRFDKPVPKGVSTSLKRHGSGLGQGWRRLIQSLTSSWQLYGLCAAARSHVRLVDCAEQPRTSTTSKGGMYAEIEHSGDGDRPAAGD